MKKSSVFTITFAALILASCSGMPKLFWGQDEGKSDKPAYAQGSSASPGATKRAPLDVPPELRADIELPGEEKVATRTDEKLLPKKYKAAVAGEGVSLDARVYHVSAGKVFSAVVDAMTALNLPVDSVDSLSGIVTSDWIKKGSNSGNMAGSLLSNIMGDNSHAPTKHRFLVRVFRMKSEDNKPLAKLEIRVLGQIFMSGHWVNKPFKRKVSLELFTAVEEQLTRMQRMMPAQETPAAKAANPCAVQKKEPQKSKQEITEEQTKTAVEAWRSAWSQRDVQAYFAAYAADFQPQKGSFASWSRHKQEVIAAKSFIDVKLEGIQVEPVDEDTVKVSFLQHFVSNNYSSDDRKQLTLKKQADGWKIIRETSL